MRKFNVFISAAIYCYGNVEIEAECELYALEQARELYDFGEIEMEHSGCDHDPYLQAEEVKDA